MRQQDLIYMNEGTGRSWRYAQALAHEVGHALDYHGTHPAGHLLRGRRNRYRVERAAVAFEILVAELLGMVRMKLVRDRLERSRDYVERYAPEDSVTAVTLADIVLDATARRAAAAALQVRMRRSTWAAA